MVRKLIGITLVGAASCVIAGTVEAQMSDDPFIGTWQVNIERSVYPGPRPPSDLVTLYQFAPMPDGWTRFTLTSTNAAGDLTSQISVFRVDGQQYPVHNFNTLARLMASGQETNLGRSYRQIDERTVEFTGWTDGVAGNPVIRQISPDGNTYVQRPANGNGAVLLLERIR